MSLRPAIPRPVFLPVLLLLIGTTSCEGASEGTIRIEIAGERQLHGLGVDHCEGSIAPDEVLKLITVRDEDGDEVAHMTVRGRDATVTQIGHNGRRCAVAAVTEVEVPRTGVDYKITAGGETSELRWPSEPPEHQWFDSPSYPDTVTVHIYARGWVPLSAQVRALVDQGHFRVNDVARYLDMTKGRVERMARGDDLPAPAKVIGRRPLWRREDIEQWRIARRDRRHLVTPRSLDARDVFMP